MKTLPAILFLLLMTLFSFPYGSVWGASGTMEIRGNTTLTEDQQGTILIMTDNLILDCANHMIIGPGNGCLDPAMPNCGIDLTQRTNVTVKNCVVTNFVRGVVLSESTQNVLTTNRVERNSLEGFRVENSSMNRFIDNQVRRNSRDGFDLTDSSKNVFFGNVVELNDVNGIEFDGCDYNVLERNVANGNGQLHYRTLFVI